ncbi:hypothetical protein F7U66_02095 [Vibrio parahaemolyticus]|nr:hypothetical protein [Vibrio parahaemolyticus]
MLKALTNIESVSITMNLIDAKEKKYGLAVLPKGKTPLTIIFQEDEIDEVEKQVADYLGDPDHILSSSNIASVKDTSKADTKKGKAETAPNTTVKPQQKAQVTTSQTNSDKPQKAAESTPDQDQDFDELLKSLNI